MYNTHLYHSFVDRRVLPSETRQSVQTYSAQSLRVQSHRRTIRVLTASWALRQSLAELAGAMRSRRTGADLDDSVKHRDEVVNLKSQSFATMLELRDALCLSIEKFLPVVREIVSSHRRRWWHTAELPATCSESDESANAAFSVSPTPAPDMSRLGAQPGCIVRRNQNTVFVCWVDTFWLSPEPLIMHSFRGKLRVVTSPDITFGADEVSASKEVFGYAKS